MIETIRIENGNTIGNNPLDEVSRNKINALFESSPSDSNTFVKINRTKEGYRGLLKIISSEGVFWAKACHSDLRNLFSALTSNVSKQLEKWRLSRTFDETVDSIV